MSSSTKRSADKEMQTLLHTQKRRVPETEFASRVTDLVYEGADINKPFRDPATIKTIVKRPMILGALIKHGANVTSPKTFVGDKNVLMVAIEEGQVESVEQIIEHARINLEYKTPDGMTALLLAANKGKVQIAEVLLKAGANLFAKDREKNGVLHYARGLKMVKFLLGTSVDPNAQNVWGVTPLMAAVDSYIEDPREDHLKVVQEVAKVSDLQIKDREGRDVYMRVLNDADAETEADVRRVILQVFKEEVEHRMKNLLLLSKREQMDIPDDVMMKIATLGLDKTGTAPHVHRKFSARSKMNK